MNKNIKIGMSLVLATTLSLSVSGCSDSSNDAGVTPASTATDVTVERGKVFDATVTDSSTPAQVATEKSGQNVYTFTKAPTYPVMVKGGWIDVDNDGKMSTGDVNLDIEMKSYGTTVTPITTVMAEESNATKRDEMLQALADQLNATGTGSDTQVTVADLLKVPSDAPSEVIVVSNATYKDMKEKNTSRPDLTDVITQFNTLYVPNATTTGIEQAVMSSLDSAGYIVKVSQAEITAYTEAHTKLVTPPTPDAGDTTTETVLPVLNGYSSIIIYKGISQTIATGFLNAYSNNSGFKSQNTSASCTDFGFKTAQSTSTAVGVTTKTYAEVNMTTFTSRSCIEADYTNSQYSSGSANILAYYGN